MDRSPSHAAETLFRVKDDFFPCEATLSGEHRLDAAVESYSREKRESYYREVISLAGAVTESSFSLLSGGEKVDLIIALTESLKAFRLLYEEREWERDPRLYLVPVASALDAMARREYAPPEERLEALMARLAKMPAHLQEARKLLRPLSALRIKEAIPLSFGIKLSLEECASCFAILPSGKLEKLQGLVREAGTSLLEFREYLAKELLPAVPPDLPEASSDLTAFLKIDCIRDCGIERLREMAEEAFEEAEDALRRKAGEAGFRGEDWNTLLEKMGEHHPSIESLHDAYRNGMRNAEHFAHGEIADSLGMGSVEVRTAPFHIRLRFPSASFAAAGGLEKEQKTFIFVTPIVTGYHNEEEQLAAHCFGRIRHAALHEGAPGHHLQCYYASRHESYAVRRVRSRITSEGWTLYCEDMAEKKGYLEGESLLSLIEARLWRAARLKILTGMQSGVLTEHGARQFLMDRLGASAEVASAETARIITGARDVVAYFLGRETLQTLKSRFLQRSREKSERDFHFMVLQSGVIPLGLMPLMMGMEPGEEVLEHKRAALVTALKDHTV
ncbi:MAG: DUF885 family protein [Candidatus Eremiobacteraeota bacterium]|nr:DUF885 family protein [Candidatus Eremiobacteraeota bacterium]